MAYRFDEHQHTRKELAIIAKEKAREASMIRELLDYVAQLEWDKHSLIERMEIMQEARSCKL